jgi:hypothetical protein
MFMPTNIAARAAVEAVGFSPGDLLDWPGVPIMFSFSDLDGNRFYVSELNASYVTIRVVGPRRDAGRTVVAGSVPASSPGGP